MRFERFICIVVALTAVLVFSGCAASGEVSREGVMETEVVQLSMAESSQLGVIWSSADPDVAHNVCLMYTHAAKKAKWFDDVTLIVWGPSAKLLSEDPKLQEKIAAMLNDGVKIQACVVCANRYGVTDDLRGLGIEVKPMGQPLSKMLKAGWKVLVF